MAKLVLKLCSHNVTTTTMFHVPGPVFCNLGNAHLVQFIVTSFCAAFFGGLGLGLFFWGGEGALFGSFVQFLVTVLVAVFVWVGVFLG